MAFLPSYGAKEAALQPGTSCDMFSVEVPPCFRSRFYEGQAIEQDILGRPHLLKPWNRLHWLPKDVEQAAALGMKQMEDVDVAEVDTTLGEHSTKEEDSNSEASLEAPAFGQASLLTSGIEEAVVAPEPGTIPLPRVGLITAGQSGFQVPSKAPPSCTFRFPPGLEPPPGHTHQSALLKAMQPMFGFQEPGCSGALTPPPGEWGRGSREIGTAAPRQKATTSGGRRVQGKAALSRRGEPTRATIDARKVMNKKMNYCPATEAELREQKKKADAEMGLETLRARGNAMLAAMQKLPRVTKGS